MRNRIVVEGARQHNLRDVSVELPRDALGPGKSSLAFDTIFVEGQRRYVESLSVYARQFLGQLDKPNTDAIEGLSPAVAMDQKTSSRNPRSTVGTITEVYDHLRLLDEDQGTRFQVLAPVVRDRKGEHAEVFRQLSADGFSRVRVDGSVLASVAPPALDKRKKHSIDVVVDRPAVRPGVRQRVTEPVETALGLGGGNVRVEFVDREHDSPGREVVLSEAMACPRSQDIGLESLEPRLSSFNAPWGACPTCTGLGSRMEVDPALVVPDDTKSLAEGAIAPWTNTSGADYFTRLLEALATDASFSTGTPWGQLPPDVRQMVLHGAERQLHLSHQNRFGREPSHLARYEGVIPHIERRIADGVESGAANRFAGYLREVPYAACGGGAAVTEDTPEHVSAQPRSHTGRFLNSLLEHR